MTDEELAEWLQLAIKAKNLETDILLSPSDFIWMLNEINRLRSRFGQSSR